MELSFEDRGAGFILRLEHMRDRAFVCVTPFGRWNRGVFDAFRDASRQLRRHLARRPWSALWNATAFPPQKPYIRASLERLRRQAVARGMVAAALVSERQMPELPLPRFTCLADARAFALCVPLATSVATSVATSGMTPAAASEASAAPATDAPSQAPLPAATAPNR